MKVFVRLFAQLHDLAGTETVCLDLPNGAVVADLLETVYAKLPMLRAQDKSILIGAGVEFVDRNHKLKPGEEIAIMPPVQGG